MKARWAAKRAVAAPNLRDRVQARGKELVSCHQIIDARAMALLKKLKSENERLNHVELGSQASWIAQRTAVLKKAWLTNEFETAVSALSCRQVIP
jgi:hypothetical protein